MKREEVVLSSGQLMSYVVRGEGSPLLLLHGWGCTNETLDSVAGVLERGFTVYGIDFPGFGGSPEPEAVCGNEGYCEFIEEFCRVKGIVNPVIVGHSFGGRVGILFASRNSVDKMVLIGSAGVKPRRKVGYYVRVYTYKSVKRLAFLLLGKKRGGEFLKDYFSVGSADYRSSSDVMRGVLSRVVNDDLQWAMPQVGASTLLIWGVNDTATPLEDAKIMERLIPDAGLVAVEGAGHYVFLERGDIVGAALRSFFKLL